MRFPVSREDGGNASALSPVRGGRRRQSLARKREASGVRPGSAPVEYGMIALLFTTMPAGREFSTAELAVPALFVVSRPAGILLGGLIGMRPGIQRTKRRDSTRIFVRISKYRQAAGAFGS